MAATKLGEQFLNQSSDLDAYFKNRSRSSLAAPRISSLHTLLQTPSISARLWASPPAARGVPSRIQLYSTSTVVRLYAYVWIYSHGSKLSIWEPCRIGYTNARGTHYSRRTTWWGRTPVKDLKRRFYFSRQSAKNVIYQTIIFLPSLLIILYDHISHHPERINAIAAASHYLY